MEITEVRIKLMEDASERLQAFCSITFDDCFVIRDLKIIDGTNGPFVAMPSRKLTAHCPQCGCKNHLRAAYCNQCGQRLKDDRATRDEDGRAKLYADIAHPINSCCREMIQERVIQAYEHEVQQSKLPGYVSSYDDFDHDDLDLPAERSERRSTERKELITRTDCPALEQPQAQPTQRANGPHRAPAHQATVRPATEPKRIRGFGEGIF